MSSIIHAATTTPIVESYKRTFNFFREHVAKIALVAMLPNFLTYILALAFESATLAAIRSYGTFDHFFMVRNVALILAVIIFVVMTFIQILGFIALTFVVVHREYVSVSTVFERSLPLFWRFIGFIVVSTLLVAGCYLVSFTLIAIITAGIGRVSLDIINSSFNYLLILPGLVSILFGMFFILTPYVLVDTNKSLAEALRTSFHLVRMTYKNIVFRIIIVSAIAVLASFIMSFIPTIGNIFILIVIIPFSMLYTAEIYRELHASS